MTKDSAIRHVSDTALWVASFRAREGQRADAAFHDPLASILAGERGCAAAVRSDWFGFFEKYGWRPSHMITSSEESQRINRPYPFDFPFGLILRALPKEMVQKIHSLTGAVLMQRVGQPSR